MSEPERRSRLRLLAGFALSLALLAAPAVETGEPGATSASEQPNILLVILDDVGVDLIRSYSGSAAGCCTPSLDRLAERGVLFENAWSDPVCSPTRAQILTGRHGFRTGVGTWVSANSPGRIEGLPKAETTIAEVLSAAGYSTALLGKWHLASGNEPADDPLAHGFDWFDGSIAGNLDPEGPCPGCPPGCREGGLGYYRWVRSLNGVETCDTRYATRATVDDGLAALVGASTSEPWFAVTSFNAPHAPFHEPPASLCPGQGTCACTGAMRTDPQKGRAALEAADRELRRLVLGLLETSTRPFYLIVVGDNGTASSVVREGPGLCGDPSRSKGTLYQGGVHVPLLVWSPGIQSRRVDALVGVTDLFATVAELAGVTAAAEDSISLVPYIDGFTGSLRSTVFAEKFFPNGLPFAPTIHERAVRDDRFKLIRRLQQSDELFDLSNDPCELENLFPPMPGSQAEAAWQTLDAELGRLGVG